VGAGGRVTAMLTTTLGTANYVFYIVNATTLALVSTDTSGPRESGMAIGQSGASFTNASLGSSALFLRGNTAAGTAAYSAAARFDTDGAGHLTGGTLDQNPSPTNPGFTVSNLAFTGTYALAGNGRGSATIGTPNGPVSLIFWMVSTTQAFMLEADSSAVASGVLLAQQSGLTAATWKGNYVFELGGGAGSQTFSASGLLKADGFSVLSGTEDQVLGGAANSSVALSGSYTVANGGRGSGAISAPAATNYVFYILNSRQTILMTGDLTQSSAGLAETQCSDCN